MLAYLDHAAATPMRPAARDAWLAALESAPGNPSSVHRWGRQARAILDEARARVADALGAESRAVRFVRGGTESDNLAVLGRAARVRAEGRAPLLVRTTVEHSAVREAVRAAAAEGGEEAELPVTPSGGVDEDWLASILARRPALLSLVWVNHETGSILPAPAVGAACREAGVPFHIDAMQAPGRIPVDLAELPVDLFSVSSHKVGGPRGAAALVVRDDDLLAPRLFGGGQEEGIRPGTEDVAAAAGFAAALEEAVAELDAEAQRLRTLRDRLEAGLRASVPGLRVHGAEGPRAPHILNVGVPGLPRDLLPRALDVEGIGASAGSACRSGGTEASPVLEGFYGAEAARAVAPLRLSLGRTTRDDEVSAALDRIPRVIERARDAGLAAPLPGKREAGDDETT